MAPNASNMYITNKEVQQMYPNVNSATMSRFLNQNLIHGSKSTSGVHMYDRKSTLELLRNRFGNTWDTQFQVPYRLNIKTPIQCIENVIYIDKQSIDRQSGKDVNTLTIHTPHSGYLDDVLNEFNNKYTTRYDLFKKSEWKYSISYEDVDEIYTSPAIQIKYLADSEPIISYLMRFMKHPVMKKNSVWYPYKPKSLTNLAGMICISEYPVEPKYPIYIISKGRSDIRGTGRFLLSCDIKFKIVVEPAEYKAYAKYFPTEYILKCPENFSSRCQGGIPVRNFVWQHAKATGAQRHWIIDDNITFYARMNRGQQVTIKSGVIFRMIEDYCDRYTNVKMAGHNYACFVPAASCRYPITENTRIYSSILLANDIYPSYKWEGTYNEDTDLSLRLLKSGYPTLLFSNIVANKLNTMTTKGGNTDSIYAVSDAHTKKTQELVDKHGDVTRMTTRFNRVHHVVNYNTFKNLQPKFKAGVTEKKLAAEDHNYGLVYITM
jgi:hypothetical protein